MSNGHEPAFPAMDMNSHMGIDRMELRYTGMSKREMFAMAAMQAIARTYIYEDSTNGQLMGVGIAAEVAVKMADELLEQLTK